MLLLYISNAILDVLPCPLETLRGVGIVNDLGNIHLYIFDLLAVCEMLIMQSLVVVKDGVPIEKCVNASLIPKLLIV